MDKKHSETLVLPPKNAKNFLIRKLTPSPILDSAVVFDSKIKCKGCHQEYPNNSIKRHLFTYYKCHQYYEQNENHKMELDQILKFGCPQQTSKTKPLLLYQKFWKMLYL